MEFDYDEYNNHDYHVPREYRNRNAEPPTAREWIFVTVLLALGLGLSFIPFFGQ